MQTKTQSAIETLASTAIGYVVAVITQSLVFPLFGLHVATSTHVGIAAILTIVSIVRGFAVRRLFVEIGIRSHRKKKLAELNRWIDRHYRGEL